MCSVFHHLSVHGMVDASMPTLHVLLQVELAKAVEAKGLAEKELDHIRMQLKSLEASYDALMAENMKQSSGQEPQDTLAFAQRRKAD